VAPATRLETALAAWEVQAHRTLAANPDPADLVRIARVQALITSTTSVVTEAAATRGHIDDDVMQRLGPALEASQVAWSRSAKRWGELTNPASRTDPALVFVLTAAYTGLRWGELRALRVKRIDLERGRIELLKPCPNGLWSWTRRRTISAEQCRFLDL